MPLIKNFKTHIKIILKQIHTKTKQQKYWAESRFSWNVMQNNFYQWNDKIIIELITGISDKQLWDLIYFPLICCFVLKLHWNPETKHLFRYNSKMILSTFVYFWLITMTNHAKFAMFIMWETLFLFLMTEITTALQPWHSNWSTYNLFTYLCWISCDHDNC